MLVSVWDRLLGEGVKGLGLDYMMAGEEKFGCFLLSEGTEGEDRSLSSGCGWLEVLCVCR